MSSIGTGYDLAAATFSPDGRIFQVEYASKAVESSVTVIALGSKKGVLIGVDQPVPSKLSVEDSNTRIMDVNEKIGFIGSGLHPDVCNLHGYARREANKYLKEFLEPIDVKTLAQKVGEHVHIFTLGISRPYGVSAFLVAWDEKDGPSIHCIDPSGLRFQYYSWAIGNAQAAKTEIEKIEAERKATGKELDKQDLMKKLIRTILTIRDEGVTGQKIEMGWVGSSSRGMFEKVNQPEIDQLENQVKEDIENEEDKD